MHLFAAGLAKRFVELAAPFGTIPDLIADRMMRRYTEHMVKSTGRPLSPLVVELARVAERLGRLDQVDEELGGIPISLAGGLGWAKVSARFSELAGQAKARSMGFTFSNDRRIVILQDTDANLAIGPSDIKELHWAMEAATERVFPFEVGRLTKDREATQETEENCPQCAGYGFQLGFKNNGDINFASRCPVCRRKG